MAGVRTRLDLTPFLTVAIEGYGFEGGDLIDFIERLTILESEVLVMEAQVREIDDRRKENERKFKAGHKGHGETVH